MGPIHRWLPLTAAALIAVGGCMEASNGSTPNGDIVLGPDAASGRTDAPDGTTVDAAPSADTAGGDSHTVADGRADAATADGLQAPEPISDTVTGGVDAIEADDHVSPEVSDVADGLPATPGATWTGRPIPDTTAVIAVLADQLPGDLTDAQNAFVASHFVGTQKLTLNISKPIRAINPDFLVLHYHLAVWQSAPWVPFITDGNNWSNDYPVVDQHESWFWHNPDGLRVASNQDGKLLMNIGDPGFADYWFTSLVEQVKAGDYDAIFADSASPDLLQWEAKDPPDPRLSGTGVKDNPIEELGGKTYVQAWEEFMAALGAELAAVGIPLIPNVSSLVTTWDNTDYGITSGQFSEGFA